MKSIQVLKKAILSEKAYAQMETSTYTFMISKEATKAQIKKAVENQFNTKVKKVRVASIATKTKKITGTRKSTVTGGGKKAVVFLEKGQTIALLSPTTEKTKTTKKTKIEDKKVKESK